MSFLKTKKLVTTAVIIALAIAFQNLRLVLGVGAPLPLSPITLIIGTLVNTCLIIAACTIGLWSGLAGAVVTPLIASLQGSPLLLLPWIIAGNAVLVLCYALIAGKFIAERRPGPARWGLVGILAAALKSTILLIGQSLLLGAVQGLLFQAALSAAVPMLLQQLITGLVAMALARIVIMTLPKRLMA